MHQVNPVDCVPTCDASFASGPVGLAVDVSVFVTDDLIALLKEWCESHVCGVKLLGTDPDAPDMYWVPTHDPAPVLNFVVPEEEEPEQELQAMVSCWCKS